MAYNYTVSVFNVKFLKSMMFLMSKTSITFESNSRYLELDPCLELSVEVSLPFKLFHKRNANILPHLNSTE